MPKALDNVIVAAKPDPEAWTVTLTWANGEITTNSFRHLMGKGVLAALADPAFFVQARVGENGRTLEWPNDIDFCADALWFETHPADGPQQSRPAADETRPVAP
jgi:hypothetical protein